MVTISRELAEALPPGILDVSTGAVDGTLLLSSAVALVLDIDPDLDLSTVVRWYVADDYAVALADLSKVVGTSVTATANAEGAGCALVHHEPDGEHVAFANQVLLGPFSPDEVQKALWLNVMHHELCHVHDAATHRRNIPEMYASPPRQVGWSQWLFAFAHDIWSEYYANRRSHLTLRNGENYQLPSLDAEVRRFPGVAKSAFRNLDDNDDASKAFEQVWTVVGEVAPHLENLCKHLGYVMGTLAAQQPNSGTASCAVPAAGEPWLREAWGSLVPHLDEMYRTHGRWPGIAVYQPVQLAVQLMLRKAGMALTSILGRLVALPS
jgi:hypothetical protein